MRPLLRGGRLQGGQLPTAWSSVPTHLARPWPLPRGRRLRPVFHVSRPSPPLRTSLTDVDTRASQPSPRSVGKVELTLPSFGAGSVSEDARIIMIMNFSMCVNCPYWQGLRGVQRRCSRQSDAWSSNNALFPSHVPRGPAGCRHIALYGPSYCEVLQIGLLESCRGPVRPKQRHVCLAECPLKPRAAAAFKGGGGAGLFYVRSYRVFI